MTELSGLEIVLVVRDLSTTGGVQTVAATLAEAWAARGNHVRLVSCAEGSWTVASPTDRLAPAPGGVNLRGREAFRDRLIGHCARSVVRSLPSGVQESVRQCLDPVPTGVLVDLLDGRRPDVVVYTHPRLAQNLDPRGIPVVIGQYHDSWHAATRNGHVTQLRNGYRGCDEVYFLTEHDAAQARRAGIATATWLANPLALADRPRAGGQSRTIVAAGRLAKQKNFGHAIEAFALSGLASSGWNLQIYGEGPERARLERLVAGHGLQESVALPGLTRVLPARLAEAQLCLLSSRHEGYPLILVEAQAAGLPVVAFECAPGVRAATAPENRHLLVNTGNVVGLAQMLRGAAAMSEAEWQRASAAAHAFAYTHDPGAVADRWLDRFVRTLDRRRSCEAR